MVLIKFITSDLIDVIFREKAIFIGPSNIDPSKLNLYETITRKHPLKWYLFHIFSILPLITS